VAWASNGSQDPFIGGCTDAGTLRADFPEHDPRNVRPATIPVKWIEDIGVDVNGSDLRKKFLADAGFGNSGAVSNHELFSGDGSVQITASETTSTRLFGLGNGNTDAGFADVEYGMSLTAAPAIAIFESGVFRGTFGTYATGDTLEVRVQGGAVRYLKNGVLLFQSPTPPTYPLLVDTALNTPGATLKFARTTF
jgi:hypothetical protein